MSGHTLRLKHLAPRDEPPGRMIALVGDAELDEGNIFEALLEGWKHDVRNVWWIVDYNRQSLDSVVEDRLFQHIDALFASMGWRVVTLKYGRELEAVFALRGGDALRDWIDRCPNSLYSEDFATFGRDEVYDQKHAEGFIRLFSLPSRISALKGQSKSKSRDGGGG